MESIDELKEKLYQEKLDRANWRLAFRLVFAVITFVIVITLLVKPMDELSSIVQWVFIILYFGVGFVVLRLILKRYSRDQDDAIRVKQPNWRGKK